MLCIISGSHGFIGVNFTEKLKNLGHTVIRYKYGDPLPDKFDYFFHLAAYGNHYNQRHNHREIIKANLINLYKLLDCLPCVQFKGFINLSTSSVELPFQTMYSASKRAAESLIKGYKVTFRLPVVSLRPASLFGPGEADFHFIPQYIEHLILKKPFEIDPLATHTWIYIDDFTNALLAVMNDFSALKEDVYSVSNPQNYLPNQAIVDCINAYSHKKVPLVTKSLRSYDNRGWIVPNTLSTAVHWRPKVDMEKGLRVTYAYYYQRYC